MFQTSKENMIFFSYLSIFFIPVTRFLVPSVPGNGIALPTLGDHKILVAFGYHISELEDILWRLATRALPSTFRSTARFWKFELFSKRGEHTAFSNISENHQHRYISMDVYDALKIFQFI